MGFLEPDVRAEAIAPAEKLERGFTVYTILTHTPYR